jgi:cytochrome c5
MRSVRRKMKVSRRLNTRRGVSRRRSNRRNSRRGRNTMRRKSMRRKSMRRNSMRRKSMRRKSMGRINKSRRMRGGAKKDSPKEFDLIKEEVDRDQGLPGRYVTNKERRDLAELVKSLPPWQTVRAEEVATDAVATDAVATDAVATDAVATDAVATDRKKHPKIQEVFPRECKYCHMRGIGRLKMVSMAPDWEARQSKAGATYYLNTVTKESQWEFPVAAASAPTRVNRGNYVCQTKKCLDLARQAGAKVFNAAGYPMDPHIVVMEKRLSGDRESPPWWEPGAPPWWDLKEGAPSSSSSSSASSSSSPSSSPSSSSSSYSSSSSSAPSDVDWSPDVDGPPDVDELGEWLDQIGLAQYAPIIEEYGLDNIEFLVTMHEKDLRELLQDDRGMTKIDYDKFISELKILM